MVVKKLKELYNVDTISQDKGWKKVREAVENIEGDLLIDFSSTNVVDPWQCIEFKQLIKNKNIHMRFVNNEAIVNKIKMMCIIDGIDANRIENVVVEVPREKTVEEKKIEQYGQALIPYFKEEDGRYILNVRDKYDQIQSTNTVNYIDFAIKEINKNTNANEFLIIISKINVLSNVLRAFAQLIVDFEASGIKIGIDVDNDESARELGLFIHLATNERYTIEERKNKFSELPENTAGMLIRYKKSKATDDFGRQGKGEVVSSRIAIFRHIKYKDNCPLAVIDTYNDNYFYTRQHWMVEHDDEEPNSLHVDTVELPMDEIGLCDFFLGSRTHFILPVQKNKDENRMVIEYIDENGKNIKRLCSIPERMKIVFDDWGIEYNKEYLDKAISNTNSILAKQEA